MDEGGGEYIEDVLTDDGTSGGVATAAAGNKANTARPEASTERRRVDMPDTVLGNRRYVNARGMWDAA